VLSLVEFWLHQLRRWRRETMGSATWLRGVVAMKSTACSGLPPAVVFVIAHRPWAGWSAAGWRIVPLLG